MAQDAQTICTLARQIAKCPSYTTQSGQLLNVILQELAQDYDFDTIRKTATGTFNTSTVSGPGNQYIAGCGPNAMPTDFLRAENNEIIWYLQGVRYVIVILEQAEFDRLTQTAGFNSYPTVGYIDMGAAPPNLYVWPPASGGYNWTVRYFPQTADITTPESSSATPWFPNQMYLITRLAGELMRITNDDRAPLFLGDSEDAGVIGAGAMLRKYLRMKDDPEGRVETVKLDRRRFGRNFSSLPDTKLVGWAILLALCLPLVASLLGGMA